MNYEFIEDIELINHLFGKSFTLIKYLIGRFHKEQQFEAAVNLIGYDGNRMICVNEDNIIYLDCLIRIKQC